MSNLLYTSNPSMKITYRQGKNKNGEVLHLTLRERSTGDPIGKSTVTADQLMNYIIKNDILKTNQ